MVALAVLNTSDTTQAWACLFLACPLYLDHAIDTALKVPTAAQHIAQWATSGGLRPLTHGIASQAAEMLLLPLLKRPSAHIKARVNTSKAHISALPLRMANALRRADKAIGNLLHLAASSAAATATAALRSTEHVTSIAPITRTEEPHHPWDLTRAALAHWQLTTSRRHSQRPGHGCTLVPRALQGRPQSGRRPHS